MNPQIQKWLYGLGATFIGGGAAAVTSSITVAIIDPDQFHPMKQTAHFISLAAACFVVNGIMSAMFYLRQSPLPPEPDAPPIKTDEPDASPCVVEQPPKV